MKKKAVSKDKESFINAQNRNMFMEKEYELKYHDIEKANWWFAGRRDIIFRNMPKKKELKILDVGCSGGINMKFLKEKKFKNVFGIDISKQAIESCKKNGIKNVLLMEGSKTSFKDKEFDIIIASDVLEHIKDDEKALSEWGRILKDNGKLILFVPAFNFLWNNHDNINHHYRRYSKKELVKIVNEFGFKVIRASYWNFFIFLPTSFVKIFQKIFIKKSGENFIGINPLINKLLLKMIYIENRLLNNTNLPLGVSVFVIAEKIKIPADPEGRGIFIPPTGNDGRGRASGY